MWIGVITSASGIIHLDSDTNMPVKRLWMFTNKHDMVYLCDVKPVACRNAARGSHTKE